AAALAELDGVGQAHVRSVELDGRPHLVGYVTPDERKRALDPTALRRELGETLPKFMLPTSLVVVDVLPLTTSGKVDGSRLPAPPPVQSGLDGELPGTPTEKLIAEAFTKVLGASEVFLDDDFFDLGGDSISLIQVVGHVRRGGVGLTARDVLSAGSTREMALIADSLSNVVAADSGIGTGPLTPLAVEIVSEGAYESIYQSMMLVTPAGATEDVITTLVTAWLVRHDVLRSRLVPDERVEWALEVGPADRPLAYNAEPVRHVDVTGLGFDDVDELHRAAVSRLNPRCGVMVQTVLLTDSNSDTGRLIVVLHHLVVDGVSWRLLAEDSGYLWRALSEQPTLPATEVAVSEGLLPVITSMRAWGERLVELSRTAAVVDSLDHWTRVLGGVRPLEHRLSDPRIDTRTSMQWVVRDIESVVAAAVLDDAPAFYGVKINDVLLYTLGLAFARRTVEAGGVRGPLVVGLEGHGREESVVDESDVSQTVGWFTSVFPVAIDTGVSGTSWPEVGREVLAADIDSVSKSLETAPHRGLSYGLLRTYNPATRDLVRSMDKPQVVFNYLGRFGSSADAGELEGVGAPLVPWLSAPEREGLGGGSLDPKTPAPGALDINIIAFDQPSGVSLELSIAYAPQAVSASYVEGLAESWAEALDWVASAMRR
ncbi:condensation domain-containing protein, partial [Rhodococcoides yunnanense]|uniref:condensation domain-containing protein n=1 Tax=Rhodococcoides yunnanense TaxID=278209 RepID=UPI001FE48517